MTDIQQELKLCREYAENGYAIANESFVKMQSAISEEKEKLRSADRHQQSNDRMENDAHFKNQLEDMNKLERETINEVDKNLRDLKSQMEDFTIVLYGRTMAGKSTLMEILRHGDGSSIGKGAQRTTLDVRDYKWNGLKVYDVPGTCSFGGNEDDNLALKAAKSADLALFLLTDDAPQPEEADRLAELKALGKPILGIVNVKQSLDKNPASAKRKLDLRQIEKRINDPTRLQEIVRQFKEFAKKGDEKKFKGGYNFDDIQFVYSHLQSAFFSQRENNSELYKLSNFEAVENFILDKVSNDGKFIRIKTFVDAVALPMQQAIAALYGHSAGSYKAWRSYNVNIKQLDKWYDEFSKSVDKRYNNFIEGLENDIDSKINDVVNNYYDSSNAGSELKYRLESLNIDRRCQIFISKMGEEATQKLHEFKDKLIQDLRYSGVSFDYYYGIKISDIPEIQMVFTIAKLIDTIGQKILDVLIATMPLFALGAWLFGDSKAEKIRKAKRELREQLEPSRNELLLDIRHSVKKVLNDEILNKQIKGFRKILIDMRDTFKNLAYDQNMIANRINEQYGNLNHVFFKMAINYLNEDYGSLGEFSTVRIVGDEFIVNLDKKSVEFAKSKITKLIGERVTVYTGDYKNFINKINTDFFDSQLNWIEWINDERGIMYVIPLPDSYKDNYKIIQITQQALKFPVII